MSSSPFDPLSSPDPLKSAGESSNRGGAAATSITFADQLVDIGGSGSTKHRQGSSSALRRPLLIESTPEEEEEYGSTAQQGEQQQTTDMSNPNVSYGSIKPAADASGSIPRQDRPGMHAATVSGAILREPGAKASPGKIRLPASGPFAGGNALGKNRRPSTGGSNRRAGTLEEDSIADDVTSASNEAGDENSVYASKGGERRVPSTSAAKGNNNMSFKRRASNNQRTHSNTNRRSLLHRASLGLLGSPNEERADGNRSSIFGNLGTSFRRTRTVGDGPGGDESRIDDEFLDRLQTAANEPKPYVPPMIPPVKTDPYSTPIPTLPFVVLCITIFGEFCSAGVAGPFLFFMIEDFNVGGEADVGFWAGIVASAFFFAQFLTSMLWASVAEKHGRRSVLMVSLVGNAVTLVLFGMATNMPTALSIRLAQGLFNGAVGVAKGAVRDLTDDTNEGRAYAIMGFCWGMGGIIGPIVGGLLEHPVQKYPFLFGDSEFLTHYPYALPCMVAATFATVGAFLSLFIGPDGGPREGAIALPEKTDIERASQHLASNVGSLGRSASKRISGYFSKQDADNAAAASASGMSLSKTNAAGSIRAPMSPLPRTFTQQVDDETGGPPSPVESDYTAITGGRVARPRGVSGASFAKPFSRTKDRRQAILSSGSAYGYDNRRNSRASSTGMNASGVLPESEGQARPVSQLGGSVSGITANPYAPDFEEIGPKPALNFAQRFLLANDDAVFSITDLWVASAINGDDGYSAMDEDVFYDDQDEDGTASNLLDDDVTEDSLGARFGYDDTASNAAEDSPLLAPRHLPPLNFAQRKYSRGANSDAASSARPRTRRSASGGRVPSLYANSGLDRPQSPGGFLSPTSLVPPPPRSEARAPAFDPSLAGIPESRRVSVQGSPTRANAAAAAAGTTTAGAPASIWSLLPLVVIAHYGVMSWHSSTFEQVFMAFLVTPYKSGGLGLTAAHFAELIAAMAFCQMYFQFVFYPKVGPPTGKFSHLAMLRIGLAIYLPTYVLFPFLRNFLHPSTDATVMSAMILFAAFRWLANVTAFTAITVLMNAMTPPHLVPLANGLAQTTSSAARFIGPIVGGIVWSKSIEGGVETHAWPFNYHLGFWMVGLVAFAGFLHSWTIR